MGSWPLAGCLSTNRWVTSELHWFYCCPSLALPFFARLSLWVTMQPRFHVMLIDGRLSSDVVKDNGEAKKTQHIKIACLLEASLACANMSLKLHFPFHICTLCGTKTFTAFFSSKMSLTDISLTAKLSSSSMASRNEVQTASWNFSS